MYSLHHLIVPRLLSEYLFTPDTILGTEDEAVLKTEKKQPAFIGLTF